MDCRVVVEAAVPVYDVETADEAVRIAISKTGEMLNPDLNYVEIDMGERVCPHCGEELETAFIAADESLVALELEMTVFNVERDEHAARIARKEIGQRMENIPLEVLEIEELEDEDEDEDEASDEDVTDEATDDDTIQADETIEEDEAIEEDDTIGDDDAAGTETVAGETSAVQSEDRTGSGESVVETSERREEDEVLPEFEELIDE